MASSRPRRVNAGAKMASLLNEEEKALIQDEFYTTQYGGFGEEADDGDFQAPVQMADVDDDVVDSDFSIDEHDEPKSGGEDEEEAARRARVQARRAHGVHTKAYREPKKKSAADPSGPKIKREAPTLKAPRSVVITDFGRKEARASTVSKTAETASRQKEREHRARQLLRQRLRAQEKRKASQKEPTQAELLEEARLTEKLNLATLKKYEEMELEARKKANKLTQKTITGPYVRYLSTSMPLVQVVSAPIPEEPIVVDETETPTSPTVPPAPRTRPTRQERTFLTFSDFDTFRQNFPHRRPRHAQQKICPITRLPAKYFDPATRLPYANLHAFRILREAYYNQLEQKGNKDDPEVKAWLEWRQKHRPPKPTLLTQVSRTPSSFSQLLNASPVTPTTTPRPPAPVSLATTPTLPSQPVQLGFSHLPLRSPTVVAAASSMPSLSPAMPQQPVQPAHLHPQQSVVLPARTTPLPQQPLHAASVSLTAAAKAPNMSQLIQNPSLPMTPTIISGVSVGGVNAPPGTVQTVKIGNHHVNFGGSTVQLPSRGVTTTLTAQQLQQLSRGQVLSSALQNALRGNSPRTQIVSRPAGLTAQGLVPGQQIIRTQHGLTPNVQARLQQPTIAIHRPTTNVVVTSMSNQIPTTFAVAVTSQPHTMRATSQGIALQQSNAQLRPVSSVATLNSAGQQIMVAQSGGQGRLPRQIVMSQAGGNPLRGHQYLQVTNQAGGHQYVLSTNPGGPYLLNPPPSSKP